MMMNSDDADDDDDDGDDDDEEDFVSFVIWIKGIYIYVYTICVTKRMLSPDYRPLACKILPHSKNVLSFGSVEAHARPHSGILRDPRDQRVKKKTHPL